MHHIKPEDLALGTVERHHEQPVSWHALETPREDLSIVNCRLNEIEIEEWSVSLNRNGITLGSDLKVAGVPHPLTSGELLFVSRVYNPGTYSLLDNKKFLEFAGRCFSEAGLDDTLAFTTTLFAGSRTTISKEIPEAAFKDARGHEIKSYVNLLNSHDGSWPLFCNVSEIRTVCFNTATANIREGGASCKHTPEGMEEFIKHFPEVFGAAIKEHKGSANDYLAMHEIKVTKDDARAFFAALLTSQSKLSKTAYNTVNDELFPLFVKGRGCYGETGADLYNAVTEHYTHNGTAEANAPGGTSDTRKREARAAILSDNFSAALERGKKLLMECK